MTNQPMTNDQLPMTKTIYIVRHGQTDFNIRQVVQGRGVNSDLNQTGLQQSKYLYDHYRHVPFDVIYTSENATTGCTNTLSPVTFNVSPRIPVEIAGVDDGDRVVRRCDSGEVLDELAHRT